MRAVLRGILNLVRELSDENAYQRYLLYHGRVHSAEESVRQAQINLGYTKVTARVDGWVTNKSVAVGDYVQQGQQLLAIVPYDVYVTYAERLLAFAPFSSADCLVAEKYSRQILSLPMYPGLERRELEYVASRIGKYIQAELNEMVVRS